MHGISWYRSRSLDERSNINSCSYSGDEGVRFKPRLPLLVGAPNACGAGESSWFQAMFSRNPPDFMDSSGILGLFEWAARMAKSFLENDIMKVVEPDENSFLQLLRRLF